MENIVTPRSCETSTIIGGCEYITVAVFRKDARETAEHKIIRLIKECVAAETKNTEGSVSRSN